MNRSLFTDAEAFRSLNATLEKGGYTFHRADAGTGSDYPEPDYQTFDEAIEDLAIGQSMVARYRSKVGARTDRGSIFKDTERGGYVYLIPSGNADELLADYGGTDEFMDTVEKDPTIFAEWFITRGEG